MWAYIVDRTISFKTFPFAFGGIVDRMISSQIESQIYCLIVWVSHFQLTLNCWVWFVICVSWFFDICDTNNSMFILNFMECTVFHMKKVYMIFSMFYISMCRLLKTQLAMRSMHLSSTLRISSVHPLHFSSTPFTIHTETVPISSVDTLSVFVKVSPLPFLTVFGSTYLIMMLQHSLSSPMRGTLGV